MQLKKGHTVETTITDLAFGGRGLARIDGLAIFIEKGVPGDQARIRIVKKKKNYAEARIIELITPSALRIAPPCPYSGICGGCKWQFLPIEKQRACKRDQVEDALKHLAGIDHVSVRPVIASPRHFGYRNKMEFSCADRRWLTSAEIAAAETVHDRDFALGLHVPGTFYKVLDIDACLLQPDPGNRILSRIRTEMKNSGLPPYGLRSHQGFWRFVMLRHSAALDHWMVNLITAAESPEILEPMAERLITGFPRIRSVINNISARKAAIAVGEKEILLAGEDHIKERLFDFEFEISANSFFQTNTAGAELLYGKVREFADLKGDETVLDLYSGTGTIPICLAADCQSVTGIEIVAAAVADAEKNCRHNHVTNCRFVVGDMRRVLPELSLRPDLMIIDPPRDGMHKHVLTEVLRMAPPKIVYVSCNPATLARDLAVMKTAYRILDVQPVDMFPHTHHIETVVKMEKIK